MSFIQIIYDDDLHDDIQSEAQEGQGKTNLTSILLESSEDVDSITDNPTGDPLPETNRTKTTRASSLVTPDWSRQETNYLLKKYNKYILALGSGKKFRTKRELWQKISQEINTDLKVTRSAFQCENRYKTVLRKWRRDNGIKVRREKEPLNLEESLPEAESATNDPEPFMATNSTNTEESPKKDLGEVLWEIFKQKEENRERRHKEKMQLIRTLLQSFR